VNLVPASGYPDEELARLFTAGYEGYFTPMHVDAPAFRFMVDAWDIDLAKSRVALDGDEPVGIANLGVRGDRGWIGGIGVVPHARRRGTGRLLMEALLAEAPPTVQLEVLEQNEPAIRLYESLGFVQTRLLEVWSLSDAPALDARSVDPEPLGQEGLPWQREDASLPAEYLRVEVDGGAMTYRERDGRIGVLQLQARDDQVAARLLSRGLPLSYVNVPEGDPASEALERLGGKVDLRQLELVRH
jgi:ribosomal protein S18 acetylase RimI-like enzyme